MTTIRRGPSDVIYAIVAEAEAATSACPSPSETRHPEQEATFLHPKHAPDQPTSFGFFWNLSMIPNAADDLTSHLGPFDPTRNRQLAT
jgi:hypothetical protein